MPTTAKTIVPKTEINKDVNLSIIKAFRLTNKRAGEAKRAGAEGQEDYLQYCAHIRDLSEQAEQNGFNIWVNRNGQTGHTYEKDYRESNPENHDYESYLAFVQECLEEQNEEDDLEARDFSDDE